MEKKQIIQIVVSNISNYFTAVRALDLLYTKLRNNDLLCQICNFLTQTIEIIIREVRVCVA